MPDAVAALGGLLVDEGLLELARLAVLPQPLERRHRPAMAACAGVTQDRDGFAVDQHRAGTALRPSSFTAEFQAMLVQVIGEDRQRWNLPGGASTEMSFPLSLNSSISTSHFSP